MPNELISNLLVVLHFLWIAFMLYGFALTIRGFWRPEFWNRWLFRTLHLAGILFVAAMPLSGRLCPVTEWEYQLRRSVESGSDTSGSFIVDWLERLIYPDVPIEVVTGATILIATFTLVMYVVRPPNKVRNLILRR